jgi:hypothetical protein
VPLRGRLQAQSSNEGAPFRELRFQLGLDGHRVIGYPPRLIVLDLLLQFQDATAELEILGEHAGAFVFQFSDAKSSDVVCLCEFSILAKHLFAD